MPIGKTGYLESLDSLDDNYELGLCDIVHECYHIKLGLNKLEKATILEEIRMSLFKAENLYGPNGDIDEYGMFLFPPRNRKLRIKWLDQRILINDK